MLIGSQNGVRHLVRQRLPPVSSPSCPIRIGSTSASSSAAATAAVQARWITKSVRQKSERKASPKTATATATANVREATFTSPQDAEHILSTFARPDQTISSVERGTTYEEHTQAFLLHTFPQMDLMRVGGANDGGVDLTGWWWSPLSSIEEGEKEARADDSQGSTPSSSSSAAALAGLERLRVSVQCKSAARRLGPVHVRELHGTMTARQINSSSLPNEDGSDEAALLAPSMAILASSSGFSKQCLLQALTAPFPLLLVHLLYPAQQDAAGLHSPTTKFACPSIAANDALLKGLLRDQLEVRWVSTLAYPKPLGRPGRRPAPIKVDMPALFLRGKRL